MSPLCQSALCAGLGERLTAKENAQSISAPEIRRSWTHHCLLSLARHLPLHRNSHFPQRTLHSKLWVLAERCGPCSAHREHSPPINDIVKEGAQKLNPSVSLRGYTASPFSRSLAGGSCKSSLYQRRVERGGGGVHRCRRQLGNGRKLQGQPQELLPASFGKSSQHGEVCLSTLSLPPVVHLCCQEALIKWTWGALEVCACGPQRAVELACEIRH